MKINVTNLLLGGLILILALQHFGIGGKKPDPIEFTTPKYEGSTGVQVVEKAVPYPVYIPQTNKVIQVDSLYREKYLRSQDSIKRLNLYLESIKIREYEKTLVDNDTIKIIGKAKTRGSLLNYSVDYTIKPLDYKVEVPSKVYSKPRLSLDVRVSTSIPNAITPFTQKGSVGLHNKKGNGLTVGYDSNRTVWLGLSKRFTLIK